MNEKLKAYLVREGGGFALYFCRGEGKCTRSAFKQRQSKKHCADCVRGREEETLGEMATRIGRGDA